MGALFDRCEASFTFDPYEHAPQISGTSLGEEFYKAQGTFRQSLSLVARRTLAVRTRQAIICMELRGQCTLHAV